MPVPYSYANLIALLAVDVTTLLDSSPRLVKKVGWFQYDSEGTIGGYPPATVAGRWFPLGGGTLAGVKTENFTADPFGDYLINSATDIVMSMPSSPVAGTPINWFTVNTGLLRISGETINGVYRGDAYFVSDKISRIFYAGGSMEWVCPSDLVLNGIRQAMGSFWDFNSSSLVDSQGGRDFTDTGSTAITYTTGIVGAKALNFNNATANYQLSQSDVYLSPQTIAFTDTLSFSFLVNLVSGTEPIISQQWTSDSTKYTYRVRATDSTHIEFSIETGGTGAGVFTATATVAAAYGVPLLIVITMPVEYDVKSPRTMDIQVNNGAITSTVITGNYQASNPLIIGQSVSGNQIVGVIDQIRAYNAEIDSNQRDLLYNKGAFA
jgi:hypothetical protein